jgi:predicted RNA-binding protein with PIN domain
MPYIIDGNNLIGASPDIALDDPEARSKLVAMVRKFHERRGTSVVIVFDGEPWTGLARDLTADKLRILFPRPGQSADDVIKNLLEGYRQPNDVVMVSSDRELKRHARDHGAKAVNSIEFYFELRKSCHLQNRKEESLKRVNTHVSASEVEQWMKIFGHD